MPLPEPRDAATRKADVLKKLGERGADIWVASASSDADGQPEAHLIPLSLGWLDERIVLALDGQSRTAQNVIERGKARLALGPTRDVVIIDAALDRSLGCTQAAPDFAERYAEAAGWDPRREGTSQVFLVLRP